MSNMTPCYNPKVCGVQNHRDGTICRASADGAGYGRERKLAPGTDGKGGVKPTVSIGSSAGDQSC